MLNNFRHKPQSNVIFASLFTGVYDVNRNETLNKNDVGIIEKWYNSILKLQLNAIVFHNSFSENIVEKYTNNYIQFIDVDYNESLKPNIYRYLVYNAYLQEHSTAIKNLFITDITDVEVVKNPFESKIYKENDGYLFCGDEPEIFNNEWMRSHCTHLRNLMPEFSNFETVNQDKTLLNCGIIGANISVMKLLLGKIADIHKAVSYTNKTDFTLDMGVFNFVARSTFGDKLMYGEPVNTVFKKYENERRDCWFRHK